MWLGTLFDHQYNVKRNSGRLLPPVKMGELSSRSKTTCHPALVGWLLSQKKAWDGLLHTLYKGCLLLLISTSPHSPVKKFGVQHGFRTVEKPARETITKSWWNRVQKSLVWLHHDICYCAYDFMAAMWVAILVCESRERKWTWVSPVGCRIRMSLKTVSMSR